MIMIKSMCMTLPRHKKPVSFSLFAAKAHKGHNDLDIKCSHTLYSVPSVTCTNNMKYFLKKLIPVYINEISIVRVVADNKGRYETNCVFGFF